MADIVSGIITVIELFKPVTTEHKCIIIFKTDKSHEKAAVNILFRLTFFKLTFIVDDVNAVTTAHYTALTGHQ